MSKHTPGPWKVNIDIIGSNPDIQVQAKTWGFVCSMGGGPRDLREANACLIAAAPDLLAALKECRRVLGIRDDFAPLGHAATLASVIDTAIAKAEGLEKLPEG